MNSTRRTHPTLFTPRHQDAGWSVLQSNSLLSAAIQNGNSASFLMYSAFEMRNAIEQLMFTIIAACLIPGKFTPDIIARCRKKDGLFKVLHEVEANYTLMCKFGNALRAEEPRVPKMAEWDIKILKKRWLELSTYCHSPLVIKEVHCPKWFIEGSTLIENCYDYFVTTISGTAGTGSISYHDGPPILRHLQEEYLSGKITLDQVITRLRIIKPVLDQELIQVKSVSALRQK